MMEQQKSRRKHDLYEDMKKEVSKSDRSLLWFGIGFGLVLFFVFAPAIMRLVAGNVNAYREMISAINN